MDVKELAAAMAATEKRPAHARPRPSDWANSHGEAWKLKNSRAQVVDALYTAEKSFTVGRRYLVAEEMAKAVEAIVGDAAGLGIDLFAELAERSGLTAADAPSLADEAAAVLQQKVWLDEVHLQLGLRPLKLRRVPKAKRPLPGQQELPLKVGRRIWR